MSDTTSEELVLLQDKYFNLQVREKLLAQELAKFNSENQVTRETSGKYLSRIDAAKDIAYKYGSIDGAHHKQWVIDQMLRAMFSINEYDKFIYSIESENDEWDVGIPP